MKNPFFPYRKLYKHWYWRIEFSLKILAVGVVVDSWGDIEIYLPFARIRIDNPPF